MLLLKFLQSLVKTLHSDGTPGQIAAGFALGAALGLTPLFNTHNLVIITALALLNVSFAAGMLAMALFVPSASRSTRCSTASDTPCCRHRLASARLGTPRSDAGARVTNLNNTVVLGSVVVWLLLALPVFVGTRYGVVHYRATLGERLRKTRLYHTIVASQAYNVYRWFQP